MESLTIDGLELPVQRPESVAALCELVKAQRAKKEAVYPVGGRTMLDFGLPPTKPGVAVDLTALNQVIDYPARDMTITVQAGITFAKLQEMLAKEGQWLPLDVPDPERMTIGGLIAANVSGPRRYGYGTLRDYVIGISFVTDDGVEVKGGGRVVKNVAGYDLMKLHVGALGTMGVITQVTLKVKPRHEAAGRITIEATKENLQVILDTCHNTKTRPVSASMTVDSETGCNVFLRYEEKAETNGWQLDTILDELKSNGISEAYKNNFPHSRLYVLPNWRHQVDSTMPFAARISIKPSQVSHFAVGYDDVWPGSGRPLPYLVAEPLSGIIWIYNDSPIPLQDFGTVQIRRAPTEWKTPERVFGKPTPAFELMRHIKRTLDPDDVFNPGRMFANPG